MITTRCDKCYLIQEYETILDILDFCPSCGGNEIIYEDDENEFVACTGIMPREYIRVSG